MPLPHGRFKCCKVTLARVTAKTVWAFMEVELDSGACGVGEITLPQGEMRLVEAVERLFQNWDGQAEFKEYGPPLVLAEAAICSGLDQAWHDATARERGISLLDLVDGDRSRPIPLYANINRRTVDRTPAGFSASALYALSQGYCAIKIAPFDEVTCDGCRRGTGVRDMQAGLERIAAVRDAIGDRMLMVDCHWRFDESAALRLVDAVEEFGLHWLECPVQESADTIGLLKRLRDRLNRQKTLLAGLETFVGAEAFAPFADAGAYDVIMPDVKYVGGYDEFKRTAAHASLRGVAVSPHNPTGPICHAASLFVCAAIEGFTLLEHQLDETPLFSALVGSSLPIPVDGASAIPCGQGLAVRLDQNVLSQHTVQTIRWSREAR
jgi:galactonate dehydratase